ncbi:DNA-binding protein [Cupriavidus sp. IDO]|nr:DNA-binding protein [Cupriavidus sp. IDO]
MTPNAFPEFPEVTQAMLDAPLRRDEAAGSMQAQLYHRLKRAILDGALPAGSRLPGSRVLAETLSIARNTVTAAYEQLGVEGYVLPSRQGTRVARLAHGMPERKPKDPVPAPATALRLRTIPPAVLPPGAETALRPGVPALSQFPLAAWQRALDRAIRQTGPLALGYGDPAGEPRLRAAIAGHLAFARGVRCEAARVVITEGAQEALALCVRLLSNPGETAWVEDPGYRGAKAAMRGGDLCIVPVRVDQGGLCWTDADWQAHPPRLIYTTPSHQYPCGAVLSAARRLELITQARRHGAWIIEDDYDSEFRHAGDPIGAMQGLVEGAPVLYVGSFSKTMFPALRVGFVVLPAELADAVRPSLEEFLRGGHRHEQLALAEFIESGQFSRHLGRMRRLYRSRQLVLRAALAQHFEVPHEVAGGDAGMHLTVRLPAQYPDAEIALAAARHGMLPAALSRFSLRALPQDNGLVLGYGNTAAERFDALVRRLSKLAQGLR